MHDHARSRRRPIRLLLVLLVAASILGACDSGPAPSPGVVASPAPAIMPGASGTPAAPTPGASPSAEPDASPSAEPSAPPTSAGALVPGALAVTVTDGLRVRSQPRVAADSRKFTPLLPLGTELVLVAGPVKASDFLWYKVAPVSAMLDGGIDQGWVAIADHDGTPWVALATDPTPGFELATADVSRARPALADARAAAAAQNAFGIALYKRMLKDPTLALGSKGVVLSPTSIVTALAMARAGAKGDTATQMDKVLNVSGWDRLGAGLNALDLRLRSRDATWRDYEGDDMHQVALRMANQAFAQQGYALRRAYLDRLGRTFGAPVGLVDYMTNPDGARDAINGWVSQQTMGRIPKLLSPANISSATRLVLVNAMYLKAAWALPFEPESTKDHAFTTLAGAKLQVPTMTQNGGREIPFASGPGWRATELDYNSPDAATRLTMTLILPDDITAFDKAFTTDTVAAIDRSLARERARLKVTTYKVTTYKNGSHGTENDCGTFPYAVQLSLPKFGLDTHAGLNTSLTAMGMRDAFDAGAADFSGMTTDDKLFVGFVVHQANIDVDEKGTEAAAATAVGMDTTGGCGQPSPRVVKNLRFNRPFLFLLRDAQTGAVLFMGRVVDPTQRS